MEEVVRYLPAIIPLAVVQLGLMAAALVHAVRHPKYRFGNMVVWIIVIIAVNVIGPIVYFVLGRGEDADADEGEGEDKV
ncbi:MAG: PLDc N-terminal domain-containing protein [Oscillospiraceae bacterium]|nr:PLDc N-terminal domain-containing protein [Oscillospiraceae bacterium]